MFLKLFLFLGFFLSILIGMHALLYKAVIRYFFITNPHTRTLLFAVFAFLSLSFFLSFFLLRWHENRLTTYFYVFAATWTGLLINLLLAGGAIGIIIGTNKVIAYSLNTRMIAAFFFILAVFYSAYGVWNAFNPGIKNLVVEIKNLPPHWKNKTVVQLSDVHLGHIYGVVQCPV